jgi:branched-chain amino acid transport system permease protein
VASVEVTFSILLYLMVGGLGSISGPLTGTFIVYGLSQVLQVVQDYQMIIFGAALVLLIMFLPAGLAGAFRRAHRGADPARVAPVVEQAW